MMDWQILAAGVTVSVCFAIYLLMGNTDRQIAAGSTDNDVAPPCRSPRPSETNINDETVTRFVRSWRQRS